MQTRQIDAAIAAGRADAQRAFRSAAGRIQAAYDARRQAARDLAEAEADRKVALASLTEIAAAEGRLRETADPSIRTRINEIAVRFVDLGNARIVAERAGDTATLATLASESATMVRELERLRLAELAPDVGEASVTR